jgi:hypothetical protein
MSPTPAPPATLGQFDQVATSVVSALLGLVSIAFLVQLILSGYQLLSAGTNKEALVKARQSFLYAFLGLIVTVAAWVILSLVGNFLGVNLRLFSICIDPTGCS